MWLDVVGETRELVVLLGIIKQTLGSKTWHIQSVRVGKDVWSNFLR